MDSIRVIGRDNARTPMQWNESKMLVSQLVSLGWQLIQTIKKSTFKKH